MKTKHPDVPWLDAAFFENQRKILPESLLPYAGQHIAWSWDGSRILDSDQDPEMLDRKLRKTGIDCNRVVYDYIDAPNEPHL